MKLVKYANRSPFETALDRFWTLPTIDRFFDVDVDENAGDTLTRAPRTNISETEKAYEFTVEMPGLSKKDVDVAIESDRLVIRGGTQSQAEEKSKDLVRREFSSTRFERSFTIGSKIDREKISAKMDNGVLTVTVPKAESYVGRKIDIA